MRRRISTTIVVASVMVAMGSLSPAGAASGTSCSFGGPTPGWRAVRFDLTEPSSFLTLELSGSRAPKQGQNDADWHLAQGILVINVATRDLEAYRVSSSGMVARSTVVRHEGESYVHQTTPAVEVPFSHFSARLRDGLPAGSYYVVAFGTDGGKALPNEWWSAGVQIEGKHSCAPIGSGEVFDHDLGDFQGGTQVYSQGVGMAEDTAFSFSTSRSMVIGLMEAQVQVRALSSMSMDYTTPTRAGTISQAIIPFVSTSGLYAFQASYSGVYPNIAIAGATLDLP